MYEPPGQSSQPPNQPPQPYQPPPFEQQPQYQQPPQFGQPPFQPPAPPKKKSKVWLIVVGIIVALLCCCGVGAVVAFNSNAFDSFKEGFTEAMDSDPTNAKVGDCITNTVKEDASDAKRVDCSKPEAKNKVVGVVPNVTEAEFDKNNQTLCDAFPDWENVLWFGKTGAKGKVLCLAPKK